MGDNVGQSPPLFDAQARRHLYVAFHVDGVGVRGSADGQVAPVQVDLPSHLFGERQLHLEMVMLFVKRQFYHIIGQAFLTSLPILKKQASR